MKKFLLLATAVAMGANFASAQTLETVWQQYYTDYAFDSWNVNSLNWDNPEAISGGTGSRTAIGINGKLYAINCLTMSIHEFDNEGHRDVYKLPSLKGQKFSYYTLDEAFAPAERDDYYGVLVTRDDAGHILLSHGFTTGAVCTRWTVYDPATGKAKAFDIDYPNINDTKYSLVRIDRVGRAMGNVLQDGVLVIPPTGYSYYSTSWATGGNVNRMKFINFYSETDNNTDVDNVETEGWISDMVYLASKQENICQPLYGTLEEFEAAMEEYGSAMEAAKNGIFFYSKDAGGDPFSDNKYALTMGKYNGTNSVANPFSDMAATDMGNNFSHFGGFDTFVLQGKRYYVANYVPAAAGTNNSFAVFDEEGMLVAQQPIEWEDSYGYCTISYEPVDETSVNIYVYGISGTAKVPSIGAQGSVGVAGQYKFSVPADESGITDVVAGETDAAPVYYNLQGVEVANPENGVYIVRRGAKVTKEVIR